MALKTWTCLNLKPVTAHTKSEARAMFRQQLRELEQLTFSPRAITRLPVGIKVVAPADESGA